jgi:hypothetical protein
MTIKNISICSVPVLYILWKEDDLRVSEKRNSDDRCAVDWGKNYANKTLHLVQSDN